MKVLTSGASGRHRNWRGVNRFALLLATGLLVSAAGCIIIPTPGLDSGETRTNIDKHTPEQFTPGRTTRAEVMLALGEPDAVSPDERKLAYRREKIAAIWIAGGGYGGGGGGSFDTDRYVVAEFDAAGRLMKIAFDRYGLGSLDPDKLLDTAAAITNRDPSVHFQAQANWLAGVKDCKSPGDPNAVWVSGRLVLAATELRFYGRGKFANEPPEFALSYAAMQTVRLERFYFCRLLVIDGRAGENHAFRVWGDPGSGSERETVQAAHKFLRSKINPPQP